MPNDTWPPTPALTHSLSFLDISFFRTVPPNLQTLTFATRFYVNTFTKKSQWDKPTAPARPLEDDDGPPGPPPSYSPGVASWPRESHHALALRDAVNQRHKVRRPLFIALHIHT